MTENTQNEQEATTVQTLNVNQYVSQDLRNSILIVSIVVNLVVLTTWIALQVTTQFDGEVAGLLFNR